MAQKFRVGPEVYRQALNHPNVRKALDDKADAIGRTAMGLVAQEDIDADVWVESGVRPKGRPFANVYCDDAAQEFGTDKTERRRILGRAAESERR